jgi:hypothetical protein
MKKLVKAKKGLFDLKFNITVDPRLDNLNLQAQAPKKLAEANKHLKKMRLPK